MNDITTMSNNEFEPILQMIYTAKQKAEYQVKYYD